MHAVGAKPRSHRAIFASATAADIDIGVVAACPAGRKATRTSSLAKPAGTTPRTMAPVGSFQNML